MAGGDLDGLMVVSVEQAVAAPYASSRLADAGARVIKVERPEGDFARRYDADVHGLSAYFVWLNRGKESIALDLKTPADRAVFEAMLARADVLIHNLIPGAMDRMGYGAETLRARHPRLIDCAISGYGQRGPYRDMKAYDLLIQAETGLAGINGSPDAPGRVGVSVVDIAAGMTAFQAILQGLYARERTGEGRTIEVSLFHAVADWMNVPYLQHRYGGRTIRRSGLHHPTIAPYGAYACGDDKVVLISIQNEREWQRLCADVLEAPELATDSRFADGVARVRNRPALDVEILARFGRLPRAEIMDRLAAAKIAFGQLTSLDDLAAHPQAEFVSVRTSAGTVEMLSPGARVVGRDAAFRPVPDFDADATALRAEFGPNRDAAD